MPNTLKGTVQMTEDKPCKHVRKYITKEITAPVSGIYISKSVAGTWTTCHQSWNGQQVVFSPLPVTLP